MKKYISIIAATFISANAASFTNPLPTVDRSIEFGGTKTAIDAYSDGIGARVVDPSNATDNTAMNTLVYKYGEPAKANSATVSDYVLGTTTPTADKNLANQLKATSNTVLSTMHADGSSCNDNNVQTINDVYTNGVCAGTNVEGQSCDDKNVQTINDTYHNGVCIGVNVEGNSCDDKNAQTINDVYHNGVCAGTNVEGQACSTATTVNGKYVSGVCVGGTSMSCQNGYGGDYSGAINCISQGLSNLDKYSTLTAARNLLYIYSDSSLQNIDGLKNLTYGNDIALCFNPNIKNLNGLSNLKTIASGLYIYGDTSLSDISGLSNVTSIGSYILMDYKNYTVKLPSTSYICQNYSTKIYFNGVGYATATTKLQVCNP